ncbi:MAG: adenylate cyclase [Actinomycetota bacterium]|nr:adenylate cyclase [Actinomycetota bacterium]
MGPRLVTVRPPNRQPLTLVLEGRLELGRDTDGVVVVDPRVSRRHVTLEAGPEETVVVTDLGSANGTTVDGVPVDGATRARAGSVVRIGDTRIEIGGASPANRTEIHVARHSGGTRSSIDAVASSVAQGVDAEVLGVTDEPGTLTIVFSDIESSTELAVAIGDVAWFEVLRQHHTLVDAHVRAHRGRVVKNQGDGYMLCFRSARSALLSSIGIQRDLTRTEWRPPGHDLRVRMGLHTGEVLVDDDGDLFGKHVVVAARIGALAEGGEILVSTLVQQIAEPRGDIRFVEPRSVELRGIADVETVWAVDWRTFVAR